MADSTQNDINFAAVKTVCVYDAFTADLNDDSLISMATFDGPITEDDVMDYAAAAQVLQNEMAVLIEEDGAPHNEKWHHDGTIGSPKEARLHLEKIEATQERRRKVRDFPMLGIPGNRTAWRQAPCLSWIRHVRSIGQSTNLLKRRKKP